MAKMRVVSFEDFLGGEFGDLGPSRAPRNSFHGKNVMVYQDGRLGPRPGVIELEPSGVPTGSVWALRGANNIVFGVGDTVYAFVYSPLGAVFTVGTVASAPSGLHQMVQEGINQYLVIYGDKFYDVSPSAPGITAVASAPGGRTICQYGARTIIANVSGNTNRVYYSAAGDPSSWPVLNFFDVSNDFWSNVYVDESRRRLAIANNAQELWALSGVPGVNDSLARTNRADLAPGDWYGATRVNEELWFVPFGEDFPVQFTGTITDKLRYRHLRFTEGAGNEVGAASIPAADTLCFVEGSGEDRMLLRHNGVWSFHALGVDVIVLASPVTVGGAAFGDNGLIFTDGGGASAAARFFVFNPTLERPGKVGDTDAQPGDASTTPLDAWVESPEWYTDDGQEVLIRSVVVDFVTYNTGASESNHFNLEITALRRAGEQRAVVSAAQSWDEAPDVTVSDAEPRRKVFEFGDQGYGHGAKWKFSNMRGVAIDNVFLIPADERR